MRIAFYAPMKPPDHPLPSGDRTMARALVAALTAAGHQVELASRLSSYDGAGDGVRQQRLQQIGARIAERLARAWRGRPPPARPNLWLTYHLYHKAPDWLGPWVSKVLGIPYVAVEASCAAKQATGAWALGHAAASAAIGWADLIVQLNPADEDGVRPLLSEPYRLLPLPPSIDARPWRTPPAAREAARRTLAARYGFADGQPLLVTAAMMRSGDKLASYRVLSEALAMLSDLPWRLLVAGDGPARADVEDAFGMLRGRVTWLGRLDADPLAGVFAAADLLVWPAIGEAWGMTLLEAQAAGLPVVAGRNPGVAGVVCDEDTGLLVPPGDPAAFARAVRRLLEDDATRRQMGARAAAYIQRRHDLRGASRALDRALRRIAANRAVA